MNSFENEIEVHGVKVNVDYYYDKGCLLYTSDAADE